VQWHFLGNRHFLVKVELDIFFVAINHLPQVLLPPTNIIVLPAHYTANSSVTRYTVTCHNLAELFTYYSTSINEMENSHILKHNFIKIIIKPNIDNSNIKHFIMPKNFSG
jgi:hypothetical protein